VRSISPLAWARSTFALLGLVALGAVACFGPRQAGVASDSVAGATPDPLGTITVEPGEPIRLGSLLPTGSGARSSSGEDAQRGVELALDFLDGTMDGSTGPLMGHPVELEEMDESCEADPPDSQTGFDHVETLTGVIGPGCAGSIDARPAADLAEAGVVMISPTATDPGLTDPGVRPATLFRTAYDASLEGVVVADFALDDQEAVRAALAYDVTGSDGAAATFRSTFEAGGGIVTVSGFIGDAKPDVDRVVQAIALGRPQVVFVDAHQPVCADSATLAAQEQDLQSSAIVVSSGCFDTQMLADPSSSLAGSYVVGPDMSRLQSDDFYRREFVTAYEQRWGTMPIAGFHAQAYDATLILLDALDRVAIRSEDGTLTIGRSALVEAVAATSGVSGLSGTITCAETGECAPEATLAIYEFPEVPLAGGSPDAQPVFSETVSLADLEP
jgi:branched-chain amino acid transport system substrate-binding protein